MRKSFFKTVVATAIVGASMLISSIATWAATTSSVYYIEKSAAESSVFKSTVALEGSNSNSTSVTAGVGTYITKNRTGSISPTITFSVPTSKKGDFYIYAISSGTSKRTLTLTDGTTPKTEEVNKKADGFKLVSFTDLASGSYSLTANDNIQIALLVLDLTDTEITSDEYVWAIDTENLPTGIAASELSLTPSEDKQSASLTYSGSTKVKSTTFPTSIAKDDDCVTTTTTNLNDTYKKYTYTVTVQESWFDDAPTYTASGNVYDSSTGNAVAGLSIASSASGTGKVTTGTGFEVTGILGDTTLTFSATGYQSKSVEVKGETSEIVVDLIPNNIADGTTSFSVNKIFARNGYEATATDNVDSNFSITVNNFSVTGSSAKLQLVDSNNNSVEKDGYIGRINLNGDNATITYTPTTNGTLTVYAMTGNNSELDRSVDIKQGDTTIANFKTNVSGGIVSKTVNVESGKAYTIQRGKNDSNKTKAVNIYAVDFTTGAHVPEFVGTTPTTNTNDSLGLIYGDGEYYVYALVSGTKLNDYSSINISNGTKSVTINEVYQKVAFTEGELEVPNTSNYMAIAYLGNEFTETPDISGYTVTFVGSNEE